MKVYVVIHNGGCEGYGEPLRVFSSKRLAHIFIDGAVKGYSSGMELFEMDVTEETK